MNPLLTTKQVRDLLKVDRITVYRMLNDGRLKGVKIGKEWRFQRLEIDKLLGKPDASKSDAASGDVLSEFPAGCVEKIEDLFGGIFGIGVTTVNLDGERLNAVANPNPFCQCILSSAAGRRECQAAWVHPIAGGETKPAMHFCHAGLGFFRIPIRLEGRTVAWVIAGQFRTEQPSDSSGGKEAVDRIADRFQIQRRPLEDAFRNVPLLSREQRSQVEAWSPRLAKTIQSILHERRKFTDRLQQIADLSTVQPVLTHREKRN
jgi:excisionase family DNA binding protein